MVAKSSGVWLRRGTMNYVQECCCLGIGVTGLFPEAFESDEAHLSSFSCVARLPDYEALETYLPLDGKIFNEIHRGKNNRKEFFDKIIDVVTLLGGDLNDAL